MKKFLIVLFILLTCSNLFARAKHHHRGDRIYTGETFISEEKVKKVGDLHLVTNSEYSSNTYVICIEHSKIFRYSGCGHTGTDLEYYEILRKASKSEIRWHFIKIILVVLFFSGIIILGGWAESQSPTKKSYYHRFYRY